MLRLVTGTANVARRIVAPVTRLGERHATSYTACDGECRCNENLRDR
jgi:hypothetical protein